VVGVLKGGLDTQWPALAPWIGRALAEGGGEYRIDDIREMASDGRVQVWAFLENGEHQGVAVTQLVRYPRQLVAQIFLGAAKDGFSEQWLPWLEGIEAWAKVAHGATGMEIIGRPGWAKRLQKFGYRQTQVVMRKELR